MWGLRVALAKSTLMPMGLVDNIQFLAGVSVAESTLFLLPIWVSPSEKNSRKVPFGNRWCKGLKEDFQDGEQNTFRRGVG